MDLRSSGTVALSAEELTWRGKGGKGCVWEWEEGGGGGRGGGEGEGGRKGKRKDRGGGREHPYLSECSYGRRRYTHWERRYKVITLLPHLLTSPPHEILKQ